LGPEPFFSWDLNFFDLMASLMIFFYLVYMNQEQLKLTYELDIHNMEKSTLGMTWDSYYTTNINGYSFIDKSIYDPGLLRRIKSLKNYPLNVDMDQLNQLIKVMEDNKRMARVNSKKKITNKKVSTKRRKVSTKRRKVSTKRRKVSTKN
jgi:hypothetical protein